MVLNNTGGLPSAVSRSGSPERVNYLLKHFPSVDPVPGGGEKGIRRELLTLLHRSSLLKRYNVLHQRAAGRRIGRVRRDAKRIAKIAGRPPGIIGNKGTNSVSRFRYGCVQKYSPELYPIRIIFTYT